MTWTQTRYPCIGETATGAPCHNTLPFPYRYCWVHRKQSPNWAVVQQTLHR